MTRRRRLLILSSMFFGFTAAAQPKSLDCKGFDNYAGEEFSYQVIFGPTEASVHFITRSLGCEVDDEGWIQSDISSADGGFAVQTPYALTTARLLNADGVWKLQLFDAASGSEMNPIYDDFSCFENNETQRGNL